MRRPKEEVVKFLVRGILNSRPVESQGELSGLVNAELRRGDSDFTITGKRLRLIAIRMPRVRVLVSLKKGRIPKRCPCCFSGTGKIYAKNLKGKSILVGLKCRRCSYRGSEGKWVPRRYGFSRL